jgi:fumarate hydratase subunit beta
MKHLATPILKKDLLDLRAGERVLLSGELYTARDQAHQRLIALINNRKPLPIDLESAVIYYCGPTPSPKGAIIGSCGPTTASRMDAFTPVLMRKGHKVMIGKGLRNKEVHQTIANNKGVYFLTYGGCGAYLQQTVIKKEVIAFSDLGPEAIYRLHVCDFPLIVGIDSHGRSIL